MAAEERAYAASRRRFLRILALAPAAGLVPLLDTQDAHGTDNNLQLKAKLVEIPSKFPPDDLYDYAYVMRYEAIGGAHDKAPFLVAHYKPRQPRSRIRDKMKPHVSGKVRSFAVGDTHQLTLNPNLKSIWQGPVIDDFAATDKASIRYWCLVADPG